MAEWAHPPNKKGSAINFLNEKNPCAFFLVTISKEQDWKIASYSATSPGRKKKKGIEAIQISKAFRMKKYNKSETWDQNPASET